MTLLPHYKLPLFDLYHFNALLSTLTVGDYIRNCTEFQPLMKLIRSRMNGVT